MATCCQYITQWQGVPPTTDIMVWDSHGLLQIMCQIYKYMDNIYADYTAQCQKRIGATCLYLCLRILHLKFWKTLEITGWKMWSWTVDNIWKFKLCPSQKIPQWFGHEYMILWDKLSCFCFLCRKWSASYYVDDNHILRMEQCYFKWFVPRSRCV